VQASFDGERPEKLQQLAGNSFASQRPRDHDHSLSIPTSEETTALQPYSPQQQESRASETEATSDERHKLDKVVLNRLRNR
jgi:hypothetical protein